ncbi:ornithine cyclodeaminase family protein [bacterium]|nr:ornithine cyclodeaminase family protein [bacterium]MCI0603356.1 ornithine cyclodeaminase family protein [bacterium]
MKAASQSTLILTRSEIAGLMNFSDYVEAVEQAFRLLASSQILGPGVLDVPGKEGMFHVKSAGMPIKNDVYIAVKVNGNFPENKKRFGLPTIQGAILLCDGIRGYPLALMDSTEITMQRTGAATAIAARHLARSNSKVATVCGCGTQGRIQLLALKHVLPLTHAFAFDQDRMLAEQFATQMTKELEIPVHAIDNLDEGTKQSDAIVTCTTSRRFFLKKEHVQKGTFVAAVGADSHNKQEIQPELLASSKVVTDILDQCARIGDLHHAIQAQLMTHTDVYAQLHEIINGNKQARNSEEEIVIFDSTGTAIQDVASAAVVYQRAVERGIGNFIDLIQS